MLNDQKIATVGALVFVGNVGEEELGNLRGMKHLFKQHLDIDGMVALEPAPDGTVLVLGTGSHRHEVTFKGPGGHSYAAFGGVPSAIHGMGRAIAKIAEIRTSQSPRPPSPWARWAAARPSTPSHPMRAWRWTSAPTKWPRCWPPRSRCWPPWTAP